MLENCLDWTVRDWVQHHQDRIVTQQVFYRGIPCWKNVMDLWVYQEILHETLVDVVVEIGVKHGGTTWWLTDTLRTVGGSATVIAIDIDVPSRPLPDDVVMLQGNSLDPEILLEVTRLTRGARTMVIADGDHSAEHVLGELRAYGRLVTPGCYMIVEDGIVDVMDWKQFVPGPMVATERFLEETSDFEVDYSREKFLITYAPHGFLRRVGSE